MAKDEKATDAAAADEPDLALVREQELAERPIAPPVGVVTDREKRAPLCELDVDARAAVRDRVVLTRGRADAACAALRELAWGDPAGADAADGGEGGAAEGRSPWCEDVAARSNVAMMRPAHDRWGVGKIVLVYADDFLTRVYHFPWWHLGGSPLRGGAGGSPPWRDAVLPIFEACGVREERVVRCLLAAMPPGATIPVHHDTGLWVARTHRVHVAVRAEHEKVVFRAGASEAEMSRRVSRAPRDGARPPPPRAKPPRGR